MEGFRFFLFIVFLACSNLDENEILHRKSAIFMDTDKQFYLVDGRNGRSHRITSICGIDVQSIRSLESYDLYGILQLTIGDSIQTIILDQNRRYNFYFKDDYSFEVLDQTSILLTSRDDSLPRLLRFDGRSLSSTVLPSRALNKGIYDYSALCMRNGRIYFKDKDLQLYEIGKDSTYTIIPQEKEARSGNYVLTTGCIVINKSRSGKYLMSVYDLNSLKLIHDIMLDGSFQLNDQRYATEEDGKAKILIRRTDRTFAAGFGDYYLLDLNDYTIKPLPSFDKFRFGFFAGFIDNRHMSIFDIQD